MSSTHPSVCVRALLAMCLFVSTACDDDPGDDADSGGEAEGTAGESGQTEPTFAADIGPLLANGCRGEAGGCHVPGGRYTTPYLAEADVYDEIVGVLANAPLLEQITMNYVEPGDPANSYLLHKVKGTHVDLFMDPLNAGERMPCDELIGTGLETRCSGNSMQLPASDIQMIEDWIAAGAPE